MAKDSEIVAIFRAAMAPPPSYHGKWGGEFPADPSPLAAIVAEWTPLVAYLWPRYLVMNLFAWRDAPGEPTPPDDKAAWIARVVSFPRLPMGVFWLLNTPEGDALREKCGEACQAIDAGKQFRLSRFILENDPKPDCFKIICDVGARHNVPHAAIKAFENAPDRHARHDALERWLPLPKPRGAPVTPLYRDHGLTSKARAMREAIQLAKIEKIRSAPKR